VIQITSRTRQNVTQELTDMIQIAVYLTLAMLAGTLLWCIYSTIKHSFNSNIKNVRYRSGVVIALIIYLVSEMFFLLYQFNGLAHRIFYFHIVLVFCTFPVTITIDTVILLIFRTLNPDIPPRLVWMVVGVSWVVYLLIPSVSGLAYLTEAPSEIITGLAKIFRFINAVWFAVYHNTIVGYLIYLVYTNIKKKSLRDVERALKNALYLLLLIFIVNMCGLIVYGYALTLQDDHPLRFVFLNLANAAVGVQTNSLIYLFLFLTELQFADKKKAVPVAFVPKYTVKDQNSSTKLMNDT
jgi:hypothetical protein